MFSKLNQGVARRVGLAAVAALVVAGAGFEGVRWLSTDRYLESTNDAYVKTDYTTIAPKISGYIADVLVQDNQAVKAGQVVARIDPRDFQTALDQARADVAAAEAGMASLDAQLGLQQSLIDQASADIVSAEAGQRFAQQEYDRYRNLVKTGYGTVQRAQQAEAALRQQTATLEHGRAALIAAQQQTQVLQAERIRAGTLRAHNQAVADQAELNRGYTEIVSPIDGTVGARSLRSGQYVQAGTALMAIVPLHDVYVVANLKETQLTELRGGERATIKVDTFPGKVIHGHVDSLAPASGLEFALLPPDNATGNFTKIVQRIPVKIVIERDDPLNGLLRAGMSVEATVDTKPTALALRGNGPSLASR